MWEGRRGRREGEGDLEREREREREQGKVGVVNERGCMVWFCIAVK